MTDWDVWAKRHADLTKAAAKAALAVDVAVKRADKADEEVGRVVRMGASAGRIGSGGPPLQRAKALRAKAARVRRRAEADLEKAFDAVRDHLKEEPK